MNAFDAVPQFLKMLRNLDHWLELAVAQEYDTLHGFPPLMLCV